MAKRRISPKIASIPAETNVADVALAHAPATAAAAESKQSRLVALLRRPEGATIAELMAATGWMSHSVRGALSAVVKRKLGLVVDSCLETDRGRVYRIAPPPAAKPAAGRRRAKPAASKATLVASTSPATA